MPRQPKVNKLAISRFFVIGRMSWILWVMQNWCKAIDWIVHMECLSLIWWEEPCKAPLQGNEVIIKHVTWEWDLCRRVPVMILTHHSILSLWKEWMRKTISCLAWNWRAVGRWVKVRMEVSARVYTQQQTRWIRLRLEVSPHVYTQKTITWCWWQK